MHSHEHASLSRILFNDRCEHACLTSCALSHVCLDLLMPMFLPWMAMMIQRLGFVM